MLGKRESVRIAQGVVVFLKISGGFMVGEKVAEGTVEVPTFEVTGSLAQIADKYYEMKQRRLAADKIVSALADEENFLREYLIDNISKADATGVSGKKVRVAVVVALKPQVDDWQKFYAFIARNRNKGSFACLNKVVNSKAVKEYWDAGKEVPGVSRFNVVSLSVNKL